MKIVTAEQAIAEIEDGWTLIPGGFGSCGHPDELTLALRDRFLRTGRPRGLTYLFAAGPGDRAGRGLDAIAHRHLVARAIGGFWGLCPSLAALATEGVIEAHNWPQGVVSKLFSAIASGAPGILTHVGSGTFIDPEHQGGVIDTRGSRPLVQAMDDFHGRRLLFYPAVPAHCALLRGSAADAAGNISFEDETSLMDALAQAFAVKRCRGLVIVQVKRLVDKIHPHAVTIPSMLVDRVVVAREDMHPQTYGCAHDPRYTEREGHAAEMAPCQGIPLHKRIIAHRAALELAQHPGANVNLGIGIPALIGPVAAGLGIRDYVLTVESGLIGGVPDEGLSFGATRHPQARIEQAALFDFYDGGGLDLAFLGFAQVDRAGNVNVSRFGDRLPGSGGFINISQSARKLVFCGSYTASGLTTGLSEGRLAIEREGRVRKFRAEVEHLTFNARLALEQGREVLFITERAVFRLRREGLQLAELAPGIQVEALRRMSDFDFLVPPDIREMPGPWEQEQCATYNELIG